MYSTREPFHRRRLTLAHTHTHAQLSVDSILSPQHFLAAIGWRSAQSVLRCVLGWTRVWSLRGHPETPPPQPQPTPSVTLSPDCWLLTHTAKCLRSLRPHGHSFEWWRSALSWLAAGTFVDTRKTLLAVPHKTTHIHTAAIHYG